jgi:hypothetical protein
MSAYVRVRTLDELRRSIDAVGSQTDVAAASHLSLQRLNQLYVGSHDRIEVRKAARLEQVLGVPAGHLFEAVDGPLLRPYITEPTPAADPSADDLDDDGELAREPVDAAPAA